MTEPPVVDGVAALFYEAVLDPVRWLDALRALMRLANARAATFSRADLSVPTNTVVDAVAQPDEVLRAYAAHYVELDPMLRLGPRLAPGAWTSNWAVLGPHYARTEYFNDFMAPHDNYAVLLAPLWDDGRFSALLGLQRGRAQGPFPARPDKPLAELLPHLQRAARLHFDTRELQAQAQFASATLDRIATPVLVLEPSGKLVLSNVAAEELCRHCRTLAFANGKLVSQVDNAKLQAAIAAAGSASTPRPAWLRLRARAEEPLLLVVTPMAASSPHARAWQRPLVVIMATPVRGGAGGVDKILRDVFGLTAAEARVAAAIGEGASPAEVAERYRTTVHTVRGQLKAVYSKTGARRQAELSRMLTRLQAMFPPEITRP